MVVDEFRSYRRNGFIISAKLGVLSSSAKPGVLSTSAKSLLIRVQRGVFCTITVKRH